MHWGRTAGNTACILGTGDRKALAARTKPPDCQKALKHLSTAAAAAVAPLRGAGRPSRLALTVNASAGPLPVPVGRGCLVQDLQRGRPAVGDAGPGAGHPPPPDALRASDPGLHRGEPASAAPSPLTRVHAQSKHKQLASRQSLGKESK